MTPLKVVIVVPDDRDERRQYELPEPYFGAAVTALLEGFALSPEVEIHIISCTQRPLQAPTRLAENIHYHSVLIGKWGWMRGAFVGCVLAVRRKLREINPQIVHGQGTERYAGLSAVFSGFPNVITIHGNMGKIAEILRPKPLSYLWLAAKLERVVLTRTNGALCNSAYTLEHVSHFARKTWLAPNALRSPFFAASNGVDPNLPILLNIGVISQRKEQCRVLDLARRLHDRGFQFQIHFIGRTPTGDPYAAAFQRSLAAAEKDGFARYLGEKSEKDLIALMDAASGLLHIPSEESFGLVVVEAMARNLKIFASRVGGLIDLTEGVAGAELFDPTDLRKLEDAIAGWLKLGHPKLADARALVRQKYHPSVVAHRHIEIYKEALTTAASLTASGMN